MSARNIFILFAFTPSPFCAGSPAAAGRWLSLPLSCPWEEIYRSEMRRSTVRPDSRMMARRVPLAISLWPGIVSLRNGGSLCRRIM
jgi:hypothetical protein